MTATTTASHTHTLPASDIYDPDEVLGPRNSPDLKPHRPTLRPSPPSQPPIRAPTVSPPSKPGRKRSNRRPKVVPSQGDAVLVSLLDGGRHPEIAQRAGQEALPSDPEDDEEETDTYDDDDESDSASESIEETLDNQDGGEHGADGGRGKGKGNEGRGENQGGGDKMALESPRSSDAGAFDLKSLAANALHIVEPRPDASPPSRKTSTADSQTTSDSRTTGELARPDGLPLSLLAARRDAPIPEDLPVLAATAAAVAAAAAAAATAASPYTPPSLCSPSDTGYPRMPKQSVKSPSRMLPNGFGELPPIHLQSPRSETSSSGRLPSIHSQIGDVKKLELDLVKRLEAQERLRERQASLTGPSPPAGIGIFSTAPSSHTSPPISPREAFRRGLPSVGHRLQPVVRSPSSYQTTNGTQRPAQEYPSSSTETPGSEHTASTPATSVSLPDPMMLDGPPMGFVCKVVGCTALPFQTQYLLNSHANVHSSVRPHYCPVRGCPRSEGGKGFKRKNEMIRHGLVHDSPGYVCPFCPDREHKYPRPDNLQRHVRVHHADIDKDDPQLRDVLSQRPDGPSRGRRRRGGPN